MPASAPPEVGVPDPGDDAGMSEKAVSVDAPTADPDDIVSGEAADASDSDADSDAEVEPADERQPEGARGAADEPHEGADLDADSDESGDDTSVS